ncbi:uncharacterized protein LOC125376255 isoform X2 [Haliotis rufescens]|uniref:uncharacterized protein LOC125376255 isoform X2 n=1 Tax=Haliotis rufescens TaxID=6454 RepID=UPI00201EF8E5|nr:uncharacterized protein LOC125376255 isoform X2 [Haliotis rufescens]
MSANLPSCQCGVSARFVKGGCPDSFSTIYTALLVYIALCVAAAVVLGGWVIRDSSLGKRIPCLYRKSARGDDGFEVTEDGPCTSEDDVSEAGMVVSNDAVCAGGRANNAL